MSAPSYTYTLTNGSTADASQVMQDFNDILNGVTDGTKDITVNAITANGTANLKGQVNLGDATADDIQFNGSLATSVPIKTDASFDVGTSSKGIRALYFGANSQRVNITASGTMSATWTLTLPVTAGTASQVLGQTSAGTGILEWKTITTDGTGTDVGVTNTANTVTINLPSASGTARGLVSTSAQTFAGAKTLSNGIVFGNGSTNLNWYEEGTWTPVFTAGTPGNLANTSQVGLFTRIGRVVYIQWDVRFTQTTASGNVSITGLPYTAKNSGGNTIPLYVGELDNVALPGTTGVGLCFSIVSNTAAIAIENVKNAANASTATIATNFTSAGTMIIQGAGWYHI